MFRSVGFANRHYTVYQCLSTAVVSVHLRDVYSASSQPPRHYWQYRAGAIDSPVGGRYPSSAVGHPTALQSRMPDEPFSSRSMPSSRLQQTCRLTPGVPVSPMLAKPTKSVGEVLQRLSGQEFTCEYK